MSLARFQVMIVLILLGLAARAGCSRGPVEPVQWEPFAETFAFEQLKAAVPIDTSLRIESEKGIYAQIRMTPGQEIPAEWHERKVHKPERWPIVIFFIPDGGELFSDDTFVLPLNRFHHPEEPRVKFAKLSLEYLAWVLYEAPYGARKGLWSGRGFEGEPQPSEKEWDQRELRYWTYLVAPPEAGEYTMEVVLFPTFAPVSRVRIELGDPFILLRERILVDDQGNLSVQPT